MRSTKRFFIVACIISIITSCSESFKTIDPTAFNKKIADRMDIDTPEQLVTIYYDWPSNEGTPHFTFQTENLGDNKFEVTMINDHLEDDAMAAIKIVMTATHSGNRWTVQEIKWNCKCYDGYGHTGWGAGAC